METYTIEQIREALKRCQLGESTRPVLPDEVVAYLTRPKFSEGQVVAVLDEDYGSCFECWPNTLPPKGINCRPLNQAEVGPDWWVPREAAMKLRDAVKLVAGLPSTNEVPARRLWDAITDFDEAVK